AIAPSAFTGVGAGIRGTWTPTALPGLLVPQLRRGQCQIPGKGASWLSTPGFPSRYSLRTQRNARTRIPLGVGIKEGHKIRTILHPDILPLRTTYSTCAVDFFFSSSPGPGEGYTTSQSGV
ncbi:hypothetical protein JMJ77_0001092, partial [Colletotrichum scovillei]